MRPADNIKRLISKLRVEPREGSSERNLEDALAAYQKATESAYSKPVIWRIIMKSPVTKLAAAAVIIIAVFIAVPQFSGTSVAWSQVVEQINKHTKYKCRQRVVREQGPAVPTMRIYHLNLSQRRQEVENGDIHIIDMRAEDAITVELHPAQKKATVTKLLGFGPKKDPDIIDMVKQFDQKSTERLGTKKVGGKILYGFRHQPNEYNDFTVWVDPDTKLPVEIELKHPTAGQTLFMDEFEFDFELAPSAFSTDVPDGYEVKTVFLDYRPVEPKQITAEDIRTGLNHTAYKIGNLRWIKETINIRTADPLAPGPIVYITGLKADDDNVLIIVQGDLYDGERMVWIPQQQLVMESPSGAKLYMHPNGAIYAQSFLESFAKAKPDFFDVRNISEERFTRMIVMPDGTIMGLSANKQISNEKLQELVESLIEIKPD